MVVGGGQRRKASAASSSSSSAVDVRIDANDGDDAAMASDNHRLGATEKEEEEEVGGGGRRRLGPVGGEADAAGSAGTIRGAKDAAAAAATDATTMLSPPSSPDDDVDENHPFHRRQLSSQLTGCCTNYMTYSAEDMCAMYSQDCVSGDTPSHDSGDDSCEQVGLSFLGISFSVNTAYGNPYSYQLCDQFPMENIIERNYANVMSMDEDGWLVGGGYKSFDHSGKMP